MERSSLHRRPMVPPPPEAPPAIQSPAALERDQYLKRQFNSIDSPQQSPQQAQQAAPKHSDFVQAYLVSFTLCLLPTQLTLTTAACTG